MTTKISRRYPDIHAVLDRNAFTKPLSE